MEDFWQSRTSYALLACVFGMVAATKFSQSSYLNRRRVIGFAGVAIGVLGTNVLPAAETVTYYYTNPQGTVLATTDAAGNVLSTVEYRPYGEQILGVPEAGPGYTGHINDPDSGLVYMQARYYDPVVGRFVAVDPAVSEPGDVLSASRYAYANSNPVKYVDPTGKVVSLANERQTLLELINARASGAFTVDRKGNLQSTGDSDDASKSSTYTNALRQAIESKSVITVSIKASYKDPATGARKSVDKDAGGGVTIGARSGGDQKVTISGNANNSLKDASGQPLRDQPADILVHELVGHAIPHIAGSDTGNAVQNENKVRGEVEEGGQRAEEPWHKE